MPSGSYALNFTAAGGSFTAAFMVKQWNMGPGRSSTPAELDHLSTSQRRSYISSDGLTFAILDSFSADIAGNLGIRAVVTLGSSANDPVSTVVLQ